MAIERWCRGSVRRKFVEDMARFVQLLALALVFRQSDGFNAIGLVAPAARASPASSSSTTFRNQSPPPWRHAAAASGRWSSPVRNSDRACRLATSSSHHNDHRHRRRQRHLQRCDHGAAISRIRRRPCHSSSPSSLSTGSWRGSAGRSSTSRSVSRGSSPGGDADAFEEDSGEEGGGLATARETVPGARRKSRKKDKKGLDDNKKKSALGKAGDAIKATFNAFMAASTVVSIALAAEAFWQLHGTPLTLSNAVPTLTKLLPLTGIGVFGAAQLVGVVARVVRVIVTLPIMLSGAWVILQNAPKLLPQGSDLTGAGSLAALLATPEVLEAAAVLALLGGTVLWAVNFATGAVGTLLKGQEDEEYEDDELD